MIFNFSGKAFKYFYLSTPGNATYMDSIVIKYEIHTYTNYTTQCCPSVHYPEVSTTTDIYSAKLIWNN